MNDWKEVRKRVYTTLSLGFSFGYLADYIAKAEKELGIKGGKEEPTMAKLILLLDRILGGGGESEGSKEETPASMVIEFQEPAVDPETLPELLPELLPEPLPEPVQEEPQSMPEEIATPAVESEPSPEPLPEPAMEVELENPPVEEVAAPEEKKAKRKKG